MKKLIIIAVLAVTVSGCYNTRRGMSKDIINHESRNVQKLDKKVYAGNIDLIPIQMDLLEDELSWQGRMKARMSGMKAGN
jgi:predicted small secreted protein